MVSVPTELPAAARAHWLAELSDALDAAHRLLPRIGLGADQKAEALDLYVRIQAARLEVRTLQLSRSLRTGEHKAPNWSELPPWQPTSEANPL